MPGESSLLGVALVVRSKDGPRFVFNYPARLSPPGKDQKPRYGTELDPTSPDASDEEVSDHEELEDSGFTLQQKDFDRLSIGKKERHVSQWDGDSHFELPDGQQVVPWEHLDAFDTKDLASILTPARAYHKKCFELTLDPLTFVTYPMHIREDGRWKKKRREKKKKQPKDGLENGTAAAKADDNEEGENGPQDGDDDAGVDAAQDTEKEDDAEKLKHGSSFTSVSDEGADQGGMTMFNMVFIMNPKRIEAAGRIHDMLEHVAKDINKALRYAQNYSNYVWKESEKILSLKDKAREERRPMSYLWDTVLEKSSLAFAMKSIYNAISNDDIAVVHLMSDPPVRLSVQIPKPYFLTMPPDTDEVSLPGLWITTANSLSTDDGDDGSILSRHSALLLLEDEDKITADIQADGGELTAPLLEYLKILKPTLSFHQTAQQHGIALNDIRILAQHLIYHRRAMAIPPLHARDTYILNPNSDNTKLASASATWTQTFPLAPPLPTFLANLSQVPRPYKSFAPSKAHRPIYLSMLAWLLRHGWVTQLRTFAWVIAWPEIRYEVQDALDGERVKKDYEDAVAAFEAFEKETAAAVAAASNPSAISNAGEDNLSSSTIITANTSTTSPPSSPRTVAPNSNPSTNPNPASTTGPQPSLQNQPQYLAEKARLTRLLQKTKQDLIDYTSRPTPSTSTSSSNTPSTNRTAPHLARLPPHVIRDPYKAEHVESLYLEAIARRLGGVSATEGKEKEKDNELEKDKEGANANKRRDSGSGATATENGENGDPASASNSNSHTPGSSNNNSNDASSTSTQKQQTNGNGNSTVHQLSAGQKAFRRYARYFDGRTALESVALLEGVKRKEAWNTILGMEEYLLVVRHW